MIRTKEIHTVENAGSAGGEHEGDRTQWMGHEGQEWVKVKDLDSDPCTGKSWRIKTILFSENSKEIEMELNLESMKVDLINIGKTKIMCNSFTRNNHIKI